MLSLRHDRPTDLMGALHAVAEGATPYAGGTELIAAMKLGLLAPEHVVDLKGVSELAGIESTGSAIHILAVTPHAIAHKSPIVRAHLPILSAALGSIGNPRIRWQGTLGGNLCFAEPRSDLIPVLVALEASLSLASLKGERQTPIQAFITDAFTVDRRDDELLVRISVATADLSYQRYVRIQHMERPTVGVALVRRPSSGWRLVVGSASYRPVVASATSLAEFEPETLADSLEVIEDGAGSAEYKRHVAAVLIRRMLTDARSTAE